MSSQDGTQGDPPLPTEAGTAYADQGGAGRDAEAGFGPHQAGPNRAAARTGPNWAVANTGESSDSRKAVPVQGVPMSENSDRLDAFYRDVLHELGEFAHRPSATAIGAAVVVKRVAKAHGVETADRLPLPRFNRAEREERAEMRWRSDQ